MNNNNNNQGQQRERSNDRYLHAITGHNQRAIDFLIIIAVAVYMISSTLHRIGCKYFQCVDLVWPNKYGFSSNWTSPPHEGAAHFTKNSFIDSIGVNRKSKAKQNMNYNFLRILISKLWESSEQNWGWKTVGAKESIQTDMIYIMWISHRMKQQQKHEFQVFSSLFVYSIAGIFLVRLVNH